MNLKNLIAILICDINGVSPKGCNEVSPKGCNEVEISTTNLKSVPICQSWQQSWIRISNSLRHLYLQQSFPFSNFVAASLVEEKAFNEVEQSKKRKNTLNSTTLYNHNARFCKQNLKNYKKGTSIQGKSNWKQVCSSNPSWIKEQVRSNFVLLSPTKPDTQAKFDFSGYRGFATSAPLVAVPAPVAVAERTKNIKKSKLTNKRISILSQIRNYMVRNQTGKAIGVKHLSNVVGQDPATATSLQSFQTSEVKWLHPYPTLLDTHQTKNCSLTVEKIINLLMQDGKKTKASQIFYKTLALITEKLLQGTFVHSNAPLTSLFKSQPQAPSSTMLLSNRVGLTKKPFNKVSFNVVERNLSLKAATKSKSPTAQVIFDKQTSLFNFVEQRVETSKISHLGVRRPFKVRFSEKRLGGKASTSSQPLVDLRSQTSSPGFLAGFPVDTQISLTKVCDFNEVSPLGCNGVSPKGAISTTCRQISPTVLSGLSSKVKINPTKLDRLSLRRRTSQLALNVGLDQKVLTLLRAALKGTNEAAKQSWIRNVLCKPKQHASSTSLHSMPGVRKAGRNLSKKVFHPNEINRIDKPLSWVIAQPLYIVAAAIYNVKPSLDVRQVRIAGMTYQVPSILDEKKSLNQGVRWIIESARIRKSRTKNSFSQCLADEFLDGFHKQGKARQKRDHLHNLALASRAYVRYRWW